MEKQAHLIKEFRLKDDPKRYIGYSLKCEDSVLQNALVQAYKKLVDDFVDDAMDFNACQHRLTVLKSRIEGHSQQLMGIREHMKGLGIEGFEDQFIQLTEQGLESAEKHYVDGIGDLK